VWILQIILKDGFGAELRQVDIDEALEAFVVLHLVRVQFLGLIGRRCYRHFSPSLKRTKTDFPPHKQISLFATAIKANQ
jgi:hypothetical protein